VGQCLDVGAEAGYFWITVVTTAAAGAQWIDAAIGPRHNAITSGLRVMRL
jgi:hypothetical protein